MQHLFHKLVPSFLRDLDQYFLLNNRLLWLTKPHYILFYVGIAVLLGTSLISFHPRPYELPDTWTITFLSSIVVFIPFLFWAFRQATITIESNFGKPTPFMGQAKVGLYTLCILLFLSVPFTLMMVTEYQIANLVENNEHLQELYSSSYGSEGVIPNTDISVHYIYRLNEAKNTMRDIKKNTPIYASILGLVAFFPALLIFIFGLVKPKDFILGIIAFVVVSIFSSTFISLLSFQAGESAFNTEVTLFIVAGLCYVGLWVISFTGAQKQRYSRFYTVGTLLNAFYTPFVVISVVVFFILENLNENYLMYIGLITIPLLMIFVMPIFQKLLSQMQSLPKK